MLLDDIKCLYVHTFSCTLSSYVLFPFLAKVIQLKALSTENILFDLKPAPAGLPVFHICFYFSLRFRPHFKHWTLVFQKYIPGDSNSHR